MHPPHLVLSSATLSNEIFCCSFLIKNHVVCLPSTPAKWISFRNHRDRKVVGGKHNSLILYVNASASNLSGFVLCNPFKWDILWFISDQKSCWSKIPTSSHYLNIPPGKLEYRINSLSSAEHITCEWEASSSQPTNILDIIAVYPCPPKLIILKPIKDALCWLTIQSVDRHHDEVGGGW